MISISSTVRPECRKSIGNKTIIDESKAYHRIVGDNHIAPNSLIDLAQVMTELIKRFLAESERIMKKNAFHRGAPRERAAFSSLRSTLLKPSLEELTRYGSDTKSIATTIPGSESLHIDSRVLGFELGFKIFERYTQAPCMENSKDFPSPAEVFPISD